MENKQCHMHQIPYNLPPNDWQKRVGMAVSVVIGCLDLDKRKSLMSSLESRNDVVRCDRQWRYKFIVNVSWTMFNDAINVDAIMRRGTGVKFL
jgi:hypothetical protein